MVPEPDSAPLGEESLDHDPVATLVRWEGSGAVWRVLGRTRAGVTVGLFSCDGGEEMGRLRSADPRLLRWVDERAGAERDEGHRHSTF